MLDPLYYTGGTWHYSDGSSFYQGVSFTGNNFYNYVSQQSSNTNFKRDVYHTDEPKQTEDISTV